MASGRRVGNRYWSSLPDGWRGKYLAARALGKTVTEAASLADVSVPTIYRKREIDAEFAADEQQAMDLRREVRNDRAWQANDRLVENDEHPKHFDAVKLAIDKSQPDVKRIEIVGEVKHELGLTIDSLLPVLARTKGLSSPPLRELPAAGEILAETFDGEPSPVRLPDTEQP